ncbi:PKD domain-containing protein [Zobellia barbeyronii]|uniref:PKD domain-containing protein n=1 Tax=Zobellia barbeyronii TaxID=2748009 RepID=A0ABS5WK12_9FLAO|nr:PKD domain-containing protein [Zobellia barbeyronii]MBT2163195.1 PKD domain-containing protein [Zobellia barbeyronii]
MKFHPTTPNKSFIGFVFIFLLIIISCTKDNELLKDAVLNDPSTLVEEAESKDASEEIVEEEILEEEILVVEEEEILEEIVYETRTTVFTPIHDAHLQSGKGYNQDLIRLEEGSRESYIMFDLSEIDSIGGSLEEIHFEFTISNDDGHGTISILKGDSTDWSEHSITENTAPQSDTLLGSTNKIYQVNQTQEIILDEEKVGTEVITLVLKHEDGNDLAFASKEHDTKEGPKLVVTYSAPQDAEAIISENETPTSISPTPDPVSDENNEDEISSESETPNEEETPVVTPKEETEEEVETPKEEVETPAETPKEETEEEAETPKEEEETPAETPKEETEEEAETPKEEDETPVETPKEETEEEAETPKEEEETPVETPKEEEEDEIKPPVVIPVENQSPIAVVDAAPSSGTAPLKVSFTGNNSSDDQEVKNYGWNFGDGNSSNESNPSHTFEKAGTFKVTLTVQDAQGKIDTEETTITVKPSENNAPKAVAKGTPTSGEAPLKVSFDGKNSSDDNEITSYIWDFKDGDKGSSSSTSHTFTKAGTYEVLLTVKDKAGLEDTDTVTITVTEKENAAPTAKASANISEGEAPIEIQFKGSSSTDDKAVKNYSWDFKDGSTATSSNPSHSFNEKGTYNVVLTVTDEEGLKDSETITVIITETENEAPKANASANVTEGEAPLEIQFNGSNSTDDKGVKNYFWDFKDGSTSTSSNPSHSFTKEGIYNVLLTVTDEESLKDSETITIKITKTENEAPVAIPSGSPLTGYAPLTVELKAYNSTDDKEIKGYFWDFKDGSTTTTKNPEHTFANSGTYQVELSVKDAEGLTHATTIEVEVKERPVDNGGGDTGGGDTGGGDTGGGDTGGGDTGGGDTGGGDTGGSSGNYPSNAVFASDFGFNSSDGTDAIYQALTSGSSYVVIDKQSSDWIVQPLKLFRLKNMTIVFESGVTLRAKSGAFSASSSILFQLVAAENIKIEGNNAELKMIKSEYNNMENRHAFAINGGNNITVKDLILKDSGGDGMYISGGYNATYSKNITLDNIISENNRRQGLSIISAEDVWVKNSKFNGSNGADPESGVALEPNDASDRLVNINFNNCMFSDNDSHGFLLSVGKLTSSSIPISVNVTDCTFENNMQSPSNGITTAELNLGQGQHNNPVQGTATFKRLQFNSSKYRVIKAKKSANAYKVIFQDCKAYNVSTSSSDPAIELEAFSGETTTGNFEFNNFYLEYSKNVPFMSINAPNIGHTVKNIKGTFTIKEPNDNPLRYKDGYKPSSNVNVNISYNHIN